MYKLYRKKGITEMRPYVIDEDLSHVSVWEGDFPPEEGDMIARNPDNHEDMWLVNADYFKQNYEPI